MPSSDWRRRGSGRGYAYCLLPAGLGAGMRGASFELVANREEVEAVFDSVVGSPRSQGIEEVGRLVHQPGGAAAAQAPGREDVRRAARHPRQHHSEAARHAVPPWRKRGHGAPPSGPSLLLCFPGLLRTGICAVTGGKHQVTSDLGPISYSKHAGHISYSTHAGPISYSTHALSCCGRSPIG